MQDDRYVTVELANGSLHKRSRELNLLLEVSNQLAASRDLPAVLGDLLPRILAHFKLDAGRVYLMDESRRVLSLCASHGLEPGGLDTIELDEGFSGLSARTRCFIAQPVADLEHVGRRELLKAKGLEVVICVPLIGLDQVVGVLNLAARHPIKLDQLTVDTMILVGHQVAVAALNLRLMEQLSQKARLLQEQKEAIQFFSYTACHDLKSPAVGIHALAHRLQEHFAPLLGDKGREYCRQICSAAARLNSLVEEINTLVKAQHGAMEFQEFSADDLVNQVHRDFALVLEEKKVAWDQAPNLPLLKGNRLSLSRVLQNLVDNALKYGGAGLSRVEVGYEPRDGEHVFWVRNDGKSIDPENMERIFEPFNRAGADAASLGTGLGLAIVREMVQRHGGRVWAESAAGQGVTFFFTLPRT